MGASAYTHGANRKPHILSLRLSLEWFSRALESRRVVPDALIHGNCPEVVAVQAAFRGTRCGTHQEAAYDLQGCLLVQALQDTGPKRMHVPRNHPILQSPITLRSVCNNKNRGASFAPPIDERVPKPNSALKASIKKERRSRKRSADAHRPLSPIADVEAEENRAK